MSIIGKAIEYYKEEKLKEKQYKRLVRKNLDYAFLERIVEQCENNPDLVIDITLADHTKLQVHTKKRTPKMSMEELFNGEE